MRNRGLFCGLVLGATWATGAPIALAQEMERVPVRLSAFLPRTPCPTWHPMTMAPDAVAFLEGVMADAKTTNFAEPVVSGDGKRFCGCLQGPP